MELVGGGSFINGATPSSLKRLTPHCIGFNVLSPRLQLAFQWRPFDCHLLSFQLLLHQVSHTQFVILLMKSADRIGLIIIAVEKLDGVGPVDNRPSTD